MKYFFPILTLLFSINVFALGGPTNAPVIPSVIVGNRTLIDNGSLMVLYCATNSATNRYCTFRKQDGSSGYTPSGTRSFHLLAVRSLSFNTTSANFTIFQSGNDVGIMSSTSPTSVVNIGGNANLGTFYKSGAIGWTGDYLADFVVSNGKYLSYDNGGVLSIDLTMAFGYEQ